MLYKHLSHWFLKQSPRLTRSSIVSYPNVLSRIEAQTLTARVPCLFCNSHLHVSPVSSGQWSSHTRFYSKDTSVAGVKENLNPKGLEKKKLEKKPKVEKILLINENGNIAETTLEDAQKIAKKKGVQLVEDREHTVKTEKKVYVLETNAQHFGSDWKEHKGSAADKGKVRKEDKTIILKSRITEHDVLGKVKQIIKLAEKGHPVRVFIGQAGTGDSETVYKLIEANLKGSCKIQQKVTKGTEIRFKVVHEEPVAEAESPAAEASSEAPEKSKKTAV